MKHFFTILHPNDRTLFTILYLAALVIGLLLFESYL